MQKVIKFFRRLIVNAAPTCTLWLVSPYRDALFFRFYPRWQIDRKEYEELRWTKM
jgi:hypothetical protein